MQLRHSYYWFKEAVPKDTCKKIIELGTAKIAEEKAKGINTYGYTFGNNQKDGVPDGVPQNEHTKEDLARLGLDNAYVRDSEVTWFSEEWIYDILRPYIHDANKLAGWNFQWDFMEPAQFTVYQPGGFYSWHQDGGGDSTFAFKRYIHGITDIPMIEDRFPDGYASNTNMVGKIRKLSMTLNLTDPDEYEGGNLKFDVGPHLTERYHECVEGRPQGSVVVFPSFVHHCVTPLTKGTRYSLVIWCLGKPFQ